MVDETKYPVFVMCGSDAQRRQLLQVLDPAGNYKSKALLPFLGKSLIEWQLEALSRSPYIEGLYLLGLTEKDILFDFHVHYVPVSTTSKFADKLLAGLEYLSVLGKNPNMIIISSCDAPGIQTSDINQFFEELAHHNDDDFVLSLVPEEVIEAAFPSSRRVVMRFRDHKVVPGELYALSPQAIRIGYKLITSISQRRRQINRKVIKINAGPIIRLLAQNPHMWQIIIKYLIGKASMADAERAFSKAFDGKTRGVIIPNAGFGMDMDLPEDYARLEKFVQKIKMSPQ